MCRKVAGAELTVRVTSGRGTQRQMRGYKKRLYDYILMECGLFIAHFVERKKNDKKTLADVMSVSV